MHHADIEAHISAGEPGKALAAIDRILGDESRLNDPVTHAWLYRKKAQCHFMRSETAAAHSSAEASLAAARRAGDRLEEAEAENVLGVVYGETGELEQSVRHLESSYQLHRELNSSRISSVLNNIGNTCLIMDLAERALHYFEQAVDAADAIGGQESIAATAMGNIGRALRALGRVTEALDPLRKSIARFEKQGMESLRVHGLVKLAGALEDAGELVEAEAIYRGALAESTDLKDAGWLFEVQGTLANLMYGQGRHGEARGFFEAAIAGTTDVERILDRPFWRRRLAEIRAADGDAQGAVEELRLAFDELHSVSEKRTEKQVHQVMGRLELQRIEHEKEVYRLKNEELGNALAEVDALRDELETRNAELSELVLRDALTGAFNRRWFMSGIVTEMDRAARYGRPLTLALIDIDHFKSVNDEFGHSVGDAVLIAISDLLGRHTRASDEIARYGGEEFAVIMPETDVAQGRVVCDKLRSRVEAIDWSGQGLDRRVTLSFGVAELRSGDDASSFVDRADRALYRAKEAGRNRVIAES